MRKKRVLVYTKMLPASGNLTTALSIKALLTPIAETIITPLPTEHHFSEKEEIGRIKEIIKNEQIDLSIGINAYTTGNVLMKASEGRTPYLVFFSGTDGNQDLLDHDKKNLIEEIVQKSFGAISISSKLTEIIEARTSIKISQTIELIPLIPDAFFKTKEKSDSSTVILPAGIRPVKDIILALDCMVRPLVNESRLQFVIIGPVIDHAYYNKCIHHIDHITKKHTSLTDRIKIIEAKDRLSYLELLRGSKLMLNSSHNEGRSNAIIEAMALKIPVIARNIIGNSSLIKDQTTGLLFNDTNDFNLKYRSLIENHDLYQTILKNGYDEYLQLKARSERSATWLLERVKTALI